MAERELAAILRAKDEASAELRHFRDGLGGAEQGFLSIPPAAAAASLAITAAVGATVALTKAAYDLGAAFDDAADTIAIKSGATGEALQSLQADFKAVVTSVPTDFGRAATAIGALSARTGQTGEDLQRLAAQMLELSRLTGTDVGENIRTVTRVFGDWSVATDQQSLALDKLFRAAQLSGGSVSEISQAVVQFGAPLRQLGFDLDESVALLAKFEREGVNTETVMGTMRIGLANLAEAGQDPKLAFQGLIEIIRDMEDPIAATNLAMEIFGKRGGADMAAAIREGRFAIAGMQEEIDSAGGAIMETAEQTNDAQQQMQTALNLIAAAFEPLGTAVFQFAADAASAFAGFVRDANAARENVLPILEAIKTAMSFTPSALLGRAVGAVAGTGRGPGEEAPIEGDFHGPFPMSPAETAAQRAAERAQRAEELAEERRLAAQAFLDRKETRAAQATADREAAAAAREAERIIRESQRAAAAAQREAEREAERAQREATRAAEQEARRIDQLRELGQRRADAINEAADLAAAAIERAKAKADEQAQAARDDFDETMRIRSERERLQRELSEGLDAVRERQSGAGRDVQGARAAEDFEIRRAREDADLAARRARAAEAVTGPASLFGKNSLERLAAMTAAEQALKAVRDQTAEEDRALALRRAREDEDRARQVARQAEDLETAKRNTAEIIAERERLSAPLEAFNQKILEDNLAEKIVGFYRARDELINTANERLAGTEEREDLRFQQGAARLGAPGGVVIQELNLTNTNYGLQGEEDIMNGIEEELVQRVLSRIAQAGS